MRLFDDSNIVFVHIPKTGGQSVVASFGMDHKSSDHAVADPEKQYLLSSEYIRFCVVRDPVQRFISAYRYSVYMSKRNPKPAERRFLLQHDLTSDINEFVAALIINDFDIRRAIHFRPMSMFIKRARPQIILRLERLDKDIRIIERLLPGRFIGLRKLNASDDRETMRGIQAQLNPKSVQFVRNLYRTDIDLFGQI